MEDVIISKKILFILLISIIAIGAISAVSAEDLNGTNIASDGNGEYVPHDVKSGHVTVGGPCDLVNEKAPSQANAVIVAQKQIPDKISAKIQIKESGSYYGDKKLTVKVMNPSNTSLYPIQVTLKFSNGKSANVVTNTKGEATYNLPFNPGKYSVKVSVNSNYLDIKKELILGF